MNLFQFAGKILFYEGISLTCSSSATAIKSCMFAVVQSFSTIVHVKVLHHPIETTTLQSSTYTVLKVDGTTPKRWRFVRGHHKSRHGELGQVLYIVSRPLGLMKSPRILQSHQPPGYPTAVAPQPFNKNRSPKGWCEQVWSSKSKVLHLVLIGISAVCSCRSQAAPCFSSGTTGGWLFWLSFFYLVPGHAVDWVETHFTYMKTIKNQPFMQVNRPAPLSVW